jgi:hypothetical protein
MNMKRIANLYLIISICISACSKEPIEEEPNPIISDIPYIELRSASPTTVTEYQDSIVFELFYQDGNGDLGYVSPDSLSLFIVDTRIFTVEEYYVPLLSPEGADITIQGILNVKLDRTIMIDDTQPSEITQFKLQIKDRAGNYSNYVTSENITVLPD